VEAVSCDVEAAGDRDTAEIDTLVRKHPHEGAPDTRSVEPQQRWITPHRRELAEQLRDVVDEIGIRRAEHEPRGVDDVRVRSLLLTRPEGAGDDLQLCNDALLGHDDRAVVPRLADVQGDDVAVEVAVQPIRFTWQDPRGRCDRRRRCADSGRCR
jgi:hypothetical protein